MMLHYTRSPPSGACEADSPGLKPWHNHTVPSLPSHCDPPLPMTLKLQKPSFKYTAKVVNIEIHTVN